MEEKIKHWRITIKERGIDRPIITEHYGCCQKKDLIPFFGLDEPDVEWYKIEQIQ